jgi:diguanylate cyclase (GGDEF)-like protein
MMANVPSPMAMDLDERSITYLTDLSDLEEKGHRIVDALAGDVAPTEKTRRLLEKLREEKKDVFFAEVLTYLTSEKYPEAQARVLWDEILEHKYMMSERLGRNVGIRVAAMDYLLNVRKLMLTPRVVNPADFRHTVKMARTDALTGLYNRRTFMDQAARILEAAVRLKAPVTLMMADLDGFKPFNDTHGHQAGDLILQEISRLVRGSVRGADLVGRYGGDEMSLLLPKASRSEAMQVAEKIRQTIQENFQPLGITISLGLAQFPVDGVTRDDLIAVADENLYKAKQRGGNRSIGRVDTVFRFPGAGIQQAAVVGDFNNWSVRAHPMSRMVDGSLEALIPLPPGRHGYKFFINDRDWVPDPSAWASEPDGFGGQRSVIVV